MASSFPTSQTKPRLMERCSLRDGELAVSVSREHKTYKFTSYLELLLTLSATPSDGWVFVVHIYRIFQITASSSSVQSDGMGLTAGSSTDERGLSSSQRVEDLEYWRSTTGQHINQMLTFAGYSPDVVNLYLDFFSGKLCPLMGPRPDASSPNPRSCLTTDGTPIEYSLSFERDTTAATLRLSLEPDATSPDLLSTQRARQLFKLLSTCHIWKLVEVNDWARQLFDFFQLPDLSNDERDRILGKVRHRSRATFGFDLDRDVDQTNAKIYLNPCMKAALTGQTRWQVVDQAVSHVLTRCERVDIQSSMLEQLALLRSHVESHSRLVQDSVRYLSVDLVGVQKARVKIYVRCPAQTFDGVWDFLTMKNKIVFSEDHKAAIKDLYSLVRGEDNALESADDSTGIGETSRLQANTVQSALHSSAHEKINICYFVLKHGQSTPTSKLFIRVQQPFVDSDATVARGLETWFRRWRWLEDVGQEWKYAGLLKDMFPHRDLEADTGLHSWIAVSVKRGKLTVESYLTPELYKQQA